jgi:hypothetical protein
MISMGSSPLKVRKDGVWVVYPKGSWLTWLQGAVVYLLRRILLDYPDELAIGILRQLAEALPVDNPKARIIIMEERLLETPTPMNCIVDLVMLNIGGKLRNEAMFGELAAAAGLRMVKYYARQGDPTCVVECARA